MDDPHGAISYTKAADAARPHLGAREGRLNGRGAAGLQKVALARASGFTYHERMSPLTGVLREAWQLYRTYAAHFLAISFAIYVAAAVITAVLTAFAGPFGAFVAVIVNLLAVFLVQTALVKAVQDVRDGHVDLDLRATVEAAMPRVLLVGGASVLASIGIAIGFVVLIVPGLILLTFWSLIVPSIVIGESRAMESFSRSWRTVRGYGWNAFGTYVLVFLLWVAFDIVVSIILLVLPVFLRQFVADVVAGALVAPFLALVVTLTYYRLTAAHAGTPAPPDGTPAP